MNVGSPKQGGINLATENYGLIYPDYGVPIAFSYEKIGTDNKLLFYFL